MNPNIRKEQQFIKGDIFRYLGTGTDNADHGQLCIFEKISSWSGQAGVRLYSYRDTYTHTFFVEYAEFERDYVRETSEYVIDDEIKKILREAVFLKNEIENLNLTIENYSNVTRGGALPNMTDAEIKLLAENIASVEPEESDLEKERAALPAISEAHDDTSLQTFDNPISLARSLGAEVAGYRNLLNDKKNALSTLKKRVEQLQKLKDQQIEIMLGFKDLGEKIEKVLTTIKLYLGGGEQIVQIRHGAWASADEKLAIRQLCLFMDQESQILTDEGGMDFKNIQQFDEWLLSDPRHLQQVLPESKGIVCLKPRKERKEYSKDKWINDLVNARNVQTYILIRHGENLYRVTPDWSVGTKLFPSRKEFDQFFRSRSYDHKEHKYIDYVITPESREFESAVKGMNAENLHYRNTLVLIQGIIDRTGIFKDLQERGVNLLDINQNQNEILYINDGDENFLLRNGKENFREYQARLNGQLNVGNRVILGRYTDGSARSDKRIYPQTANYPSLDEIYLLEKNSSGDFVIRYERSDTIYAYDNFRGFHSKDPERRASFKLYKDDKFILAYDLASADEMDEFINDRLSRDAYLDLLPLLKTIRKLKRAEEKEEEEFLLMITGELLKLHPAGDPDDFRRTARRLINWFKFKNRWHRALKDDYAKALRMIMKEYRLENQFAETQKGATEIDVAGILTPVTLFIGRQKRQIVRFERADNFGTRLTQTNFSFDQISFREIRRKERFVLRKDLLNTEELYAHADWQKWLFGYEVKENYVTESDASSFLAMLDYPNSPLNAEVVKQLKAMTERSYLHERGNRVINKSLPLAVYVKGNRIVVVYYINYSMDASRISSTSSYLYSFEFENGTNYGFDCVNYHQRECETKKLDEYMKATINAGWFPKIEAKHVIRTYEENNLEIRADMLACESRREHISNVRQMTRDKVEVLRKTINDDLEARAKKVYLDSFGDERNWEYYRPNAGIDYLKWDQVKILAETLSDFWLLTDNAEELLTGKTLSEIKNVIPLTVKDEWKREHAAFPERLFALGYGDYILFAGGKSDEENE